MTRDKDGEELGARVNQYQQIEGEKIIRELMLSDERHNVVDGTYITPCGTWQAKSNCHLNMRFEVKAVPSQIHQTVG